MVTIWAPIEHLQGIYNERNEALKKNENINAYGNLYMEIVYNQRNKTSDETMKGNNIATMQRRPSGQQNRAYHASSTANNCYTTKHPFVRTLLRNGKTA